MPMCSKSAFAIKYSRSLLKYWPERKLVGVTGRAAPPEKANTQANENAIEIGLSLNHVTKGFTQRYQLFGSHLAVRGLQTITSTVPNMPTSPARNSQDGP
jgi:hypothetical protein